MTANPVVVVGDAIVDAVETDSERRVYPGGAALNLAVGLKRLGVPSILAARIGQDQAGFRLQRYLRDEGVVLLNSRNADFTGVATSRRLDGEPSYSFNPSMFRRRIAFSTQLLDAVSKAPAVAVNSFAFDRPGQAERLYHALRDAPGLRILDPNVRPALIDDLGEFRSGFDRVASRASLIKLSDEDLQLLYGRSDGEIAGRYLECGVDVVLRTHGRRGASVRTRSGDCATVSAARLDEPVVDTMGGGDATLAAIIAFLLTEGTPSGEADWRRCLRRAMDVAAATCRSAGAALVLPTS